MAVFAEVVSLFEVARQYEVAADVQEMREQLGWVTKMA